MAEVSFSRVMPTNLHQLFSRSTPVGVENPKPPIAEARGHHLGGFMKCPPDHVEVLHGFTVTIRYPRMVENYRCSRTEEFPLSSKLLCHLGQCLSLLFIQVIRLQLTLTVLQPDQLGVVPARDMGGFGRFSRVCRPTPMINPPCGSLRVVLV